MFLESGMGRMEGESVMPSLLQSLVCKSYIVKILDTVITRHNPRWLCKWKGSNLFRYSLLGLKWNDDQHFRLMLPDRLCGPLGPYLPWLFCHRSVHQQLFISTPSLTFLFFRIASINTTLQKKLNWPMPVCLILTTQMQLTCQCSQLYVTLCFS
jgi:hypothetical protein